jgi:single-stranded DNA-binding protein
MSGGRPATRPSWSKTRGSSEEKPFWTRVGSAWPHGDGKGLNIQLASGVAVTGRLVLREYTEKDAEEDEKKVAKFKKK